MSGITQSMDRAAVLSPCGRYRYALSRRWATGGRAVIWLMLNPSTADAHRDDPTLRRVTGYARAWGYSALTVVNLYAYRATDPRALFTASDPIGPGNDAHIRRAAETGERIIAAWGAHARPDRIAAVLALLEHARATDRVHALALTASGQPKHPLYLRADLAPAPWPATAPDRP
jgi:hypothetical protein